VSVELQLEHGQRSWRMHRPLRVPFAPDGLFPDGSVIRRVYADAVCGLGAGTALLLQLAHPSIAQGVHDHSDYEQRPLDRLLGTLYAGNMVVFGSRADAEYIRTVMARVHARVVGPGYRALDPALLCWVNATLVGTALQFYTRLVAPLSIAERDEFVDDARRVGEVFGCPLDRQPATWAEFEAYWDTMIASLVVSDTARRVAGSLLRGNGLPARPAWLPVLAVARAITAATLPPRLRDAYDLPWRPVDRALADLALGSARVVLPRLPAPWRQLGPQLLRAPGATEVHARRRGERSRRPARGTARLRPRRVGRG